MPQELTPEEIQKIHDEVDAEIAKGGMPSDDDIEALIESLNEEAA